MYENKNAAHSLFLSGDSKMKRMLTFADQDVFALKADVHWNSDHIQEADGYICHLSKGTQWLCNGRGVSAPWAGLASA